MIQRSELAKTLNLKFSDKGLDLNVNLPVESIGDLLRRVFSSIKNQKTTIYVRGFADGSLYENWTKQLINDFEYTELKFCPLINRQSEFDTNYEIQEQIMKVPFNYKNEHLPNLRAEYVKREMILPYLKRENLDSKIDVKILEGKVIDRVFEEDRLRFVDVFIEFY